ncbi:MAG: hypothetical protein RIE58_00790 [Vicingaceae bacterium]
MKQLGILSIFLLLLLFMGCKKEENDQAPVVPNNKSSVNLFPDGGFEFPNSLSTYWSSYSADSTSQDQKIKKNGQASLYILANTTSDFYHKAFSIQKNYYYEFSCWYKFLGQTSTIDNFILGFKQDGQFPYYVDPVGVWPGTVNINWTYFTDTIYFTSSSDVEFLLHSNVQETWIDDLVLKALGPGPPGPPVPPGPPGLSSICDGGFEHAGSIDSCWSRWFGMDTLYQDTVIMNKGKASLHIVNNPFANSQIDHEPISIDVTRKYKLSFSYKLVGNVNMDGDGFFLFLSQNGKVVYAKDPVGTWTSNANIPWSTFVDTIRLTDTALVTLGIFTNVENTWLDDVVFERL